MYLESTTPSSDRPILLRIVREVPLANKIELVCWTAVALAIEIFTRAIC